MADGTLNKGDSTLNKGKITRKLIPYLGGLMLALATIGFFLQSGDEAAPDKDAARKQKEALEALRAGSSEEEARGQLAAQEKKLREQLANRQPIANAPPPPLSGLPPPPRFDENSMAAYAAAKAASKPASKEKMSMVAFEDFPGQKKGFAPQNPVGNGQTNESSRGGERRNDAADPATNDANREWASKTEGRVKAGVSEFLKPDVAAVKSVLLQGTIINAVTRTGLNTKLPGQIVASVSQDVYDSIKGEALLLPKGSRLIGEYNTSIMDGQNRVMMAFTRLIYPSGASVKLGAMSAADALGVAGVEGDVNTYFFKRLGSTLMLAALAYTIPNPDSVTIVDMGGGSGGGGATAAGKILSGAAKNEIDRSRKATPDISLAHGSKISLILAADLALPTSITSKFPTED